MYEKIIKAIKDLKRNIRFLRIETKEIYCSKCGKNDFEHYEFWKWRKRAIKKEVKVLCYSCCDYEYFVEKEDIKSGVIK